MQLWKVLIATLAAAGLAACSSTPDKAAEIEDKGSTTTSSTAGGDGSQTSGVPGQGAGAGSGLGADSAVTDPLKDPRSPLSQRIVYFDYDSFVVRSEFRPLLEAHAAYLKSRPDARVVVEGNTDERGSREYNLALGQKRAEAVKQYFTLLGVNANQVDTVSFGEEKPRNPALTEEAFAENRRGELRYAGE